MAHLDNLWSVLKYDLKTALDVVGLPCCLKLADDTMGNVSHEVLERSGIGIGSLIKIEREVRLPCVRAQICAPLDPDWMVFTKGAEFVEEHKYHVGKELVIPLGYRGKFRLCDRSGGTEYQNIREVVTEFPRFVRLEQDTVCAASSPRKSSPVVHAGTELELDRVTEGNKVIRGRRENYLICSDRNSHREYTFQVFCPGVFTKMTDNTKYTLAELVERLPLPRTVESLRVNPYDVVSADDEEAKELLLMMSGPIDILEITVVTMYVGLIQSKDSSHCDIICIPADCDLDKQVMVNIPMTYIVDGVENPYCMYKLGHLNLDVVKEGLYLRPLDSRNLTLLKNLKSRDILYGQDELPDTPRLPRRQENYMTLKSTVSAPNETETSETDAPTEPRKRFLSTGDIKNRISGSIHSPERESRGIRAYLSQLTRRMKSSASQLLFGIDSYTPGDLGSRRDPERGSVRSVRSMRTRKKRQSAASKSAGFVCYINKDFCDSKEATESASEPQTDNVSVEPEPENIIPVEEKNEQDSAHSNNADSVCKVERGGDEVIYAYIDRTSQTKSDKHIPCSVCQEISATLDLQEIRDG